MSARLIPVRSIEHYDCEFERDLIRAITRAIVFETPFNGPIASLETITALAACLGTALALAPELDAPSRRREALRRISESVRLGLTIGRSQVAGHA